MKKKILSVQCLIVVFLFCFYTAYNSDALQVKAKGEEPENIKLTTDQSKELKEIDPYTESIKQGINITERGFYYQKVSNESEVSYSFETEVEKEVDVVLNEGTVGTNLDSESKEDAIYQSFDDIKENISDRELILLKNDYLCEQNPQISIELTWPDRNNSDFSAYYFLNNQKVIISLVSIPKESSSFHFGKNIPGEITECYSVESDINNKWICFTAMNDEVEINSGVIVVEDGTAIYQIDLEGGNKMELLTILENVILN